MRKQKENFEFRLETNPSGLYLLLSFEIYAKFEVFRGTLYLIVIWLKVKITKA